jgi:hypothetical protein
LAETASPADRTAAEQAVGADAGGGDLRSDDTAEDVGDAEGEGGVRNGQRKVTAKGQKLRIGTRVSRMG